MIFLNFCWFKFPHCCLTKSDHQLPAEQCTELQTPEQMPINHEAVSCSII